MRLNAVGRYSEWCANLLIDNGLNFAIFSERALNSVEKLSDFDSAIPWFESRRPSQPLLSLGRRPRNRERVRVVAAF